MYDMEIDPEKDSAYFDKGLNDFQIGNLQN